MQQDIDPADPAYLLCAGHGCARRRAAGRVPHQPLEESRLCRACSDALTSGLARLPEVFTQCGHLLGGSARYGDKVSGGPMPGMPFNTAAAEVRAAILGVLASWAGLVAQERRVTPPARAVPALAEFLGRHVSWLAAHETAVEVSNEVAGLLRSAQRIAYPNPQRRVRIGSCVAVGCPGELVALIRPEEPLSPVEVNCDANPEHTWHHNQWLDLSRRMRQRSTPESTGVTAHWLSAEDISRLWQMPYGSIYRLASERNWRRRRQGSRVFYHESDVRQACESRDPGRPVG